ncbi:MAG: hypothetical protein JW723_13660 [Bacteroidales bacterium]|nr:hypothetical protein [Bacteroidales bacterium]
MKKYLAPIQRLIIIFLLIAPPFMCFTTIIPERPENAYSFEIQNSQKETYKIVLKSLEVLEYKINGKVKNKFIEGYTSDYEVYSVASDGNSFTAYSYKEVIYYAKIWMEIVSEQKTMVYIQVMEKSRIVDGDKVKEESDINRNESKEKELSHEIKKIL